MAYRDGIFAVTWTPTDPMAYGAIVCTRLTVDGALVDEAPVRLASGGQGMGVVATDDDFVAVWTGDFGPSMDDLDVGFAVLGGTGGVLADGTLTATGRNEVGSAPVFGGRDVFVPWQEYDVGSRSARIALRRVHPSGAVLDGAAFEVAEVWPVTGIASASTGHGDALVVWDDIDHSPDIAATRLRMRLVHEDVSP